MMCASVENPPDCLIWQDALAAKYDGVGEFGRKEWNSIYMYIYFWEIATSELFDYCI